jgi:hypothetical protein
MPLYCSTLTADELAMVRKQLQNLPEKHVLRQEVENADVKVTEEGNITIFESQKGFYFRSGSAWQAIQDDIQHPRNFLCSPFEIDKDPTSPDRIRTRFQEAVGFAYSQAMETAVIERESKTILLLKLPLLALRHLIASNGGTIKTAFAGSTDMLKQIPTLNYFLKFPDTTEHVSSVFATEYPPGDYEKVMAIHNAIVREVVKNHSKGICLKWVGRWDA